MKLTPSLGQVNSKLSDMCYSDANYFTSGFISEPHAAEIDSIASMKLFKKYYGKPSLIEQAKKQLRSNRPPPSFAKQNDYRWEGVCMAAYMPSKCFCGAPTLKSD